MRRIVRTSFAALVTVGTLAAVTPAGAATAATAVKARPSAGCNAPQTFGANRTPDTQVQVAVPGQTGEYATRWYYENVPSTASATKPSPLVVDLHGYSEGATVHRLMSGLSTLGEREGFITVTPQGQGPVPRWDTALTKSPDVAFIGAMLDQVEAQRCIDLNRVYVAGLSNGAFMTSAMACVYADRFAAAAPVAGIQAVKGCKPARPVPVVTFHGTADGYVSYTGGLGKDALNLPAADGSGKKLGEAGGLPKEATNGPTVPEATKAWAKRNGCVTTAKRTKVSSDVTRFAYSGCKGGAEVQLYRVTGGGHTWPGSAFSKQVGALVGKTTMTIDADTIMWKFFQAHPLAGAKR
jgi:polyhydroxybutyrate depolymerase